MIKEVKKKTMNNKIDWLLSHNKNYTKEQMHTLEDLKEQILQLRDTLNSIMSHAYNGNTIGYTKIAIRIMEGE
ncbi:MAG: hypothetical protein J6T10_20070 [Methanobrevibacter sp.]|nr:hypothetical protein [Methanobrevibacter sp.]